MNKPSKIEISHRTIVFTVVFLLSLWLLYQIRDIIFLFFISLLIMFILNSMVTKLSKFKVPRPASVMIVYLLAFAILGFLLSLIIPPLISESANFVLGTPKYLDNFGLFGVYSEQVVREFIAQIGSLPGQIAKLTLSLFSNALSLVTVLLFAFYLLVYRDRLDEQLGHFFGSKRKIQIGRVLDLLEKRMGGWVKGQFLLMLIVWITTYIGLLLLGIPFALPLSLLAGILEVVPNIGPVVAAIPAVIIGFGISPIVGLATVALAFLVQQVENYVFVPKIMEKSAGVNPIVTLLSLAIGFRLAGIPGLLVSIPFYITLQVIVGEYLASSKASK